MGRFSDKKRAELREKIQKTSLVLFSKYGIKKTTIDDVAKATGVAKGTFYLFYSSKEELIFELIKKGYLPRNEFLQSLQSANSMNAKTFKEAFKKMIKELAENPLLPMLYQSGDEEYIVQILSHDKMVEHRKDDEQFIQTLLDILRQKGFEPKRSPEVISGLFHLIWLSVIYRADIAKERFDEIEDLVTDMVCQELTGKKSLDMTSACAMPGLHSAIH
jgi:AcrR family transcriptional regulator